MSLPLPSYHSGVVHVVATGHRLALSSVAISNCAECDWSSDGGYEQPAGARGPE